MPNYNKSDIRILSCIQVAGGTNELTGVTIAQIEEGCKLSATKIRATLKLLISEEVVKEGFKSFNAKSYFITEKGRELLKSFNCPLA